MKKRAKRFALYIIGTKSHSFLQNLLISNHMYKARESIVTCKWLTIRVKRQCSPFLPKPLSFSAYPVSGFAASQFTSFNRSKTSKKTQMIPGFLMKYIQNEHICPAMKLHHWGNLLPESFLTTSKSEILASSSSSMYISASINSPESSNTMGRIGSELALGNLAALFFDLPVLSMKSSSSLELPLETLRESLLLLDESLLSVLVELGFSRL